MAEQRRTKILVDDFSEGIGIRFLGPQVLVTLLGLTGGEKGGR